MKRIALAALAALTLPLALGSCGEGYDPAANGGIDGARLLNAQADGANWISYGRNYEEQRFSPLAQINDGECRANSALHGLPIWTPRAGRKPRRW